MTSALLATGSLARAETSATVSPRTWVHATSRTTWIYPGPRVSSRPLGYVRAGHTLEARPDPTRRGAGCLRGWVAVAPRGFICLDRASIGAAPRYARALSETLSDGGPLAFEFGWSSGATAFRRVPSPLEAARAQRRLDEPRDDAFAGVNPAGALMALLAPSERSHPSALPWFLRGDGSAREAEERELVREFVSRGSLVAYTRRFSAAGRDWLLRTDGSLVAAELVRPFRRSNFRGVELGATLRLPIAWLRDVDAAKYGFADGRARAGGAVWPRRTALALDPQRRGVTVAGQRYLRTREVSAEGVPLFVRAADATVVDELASLPIDAGTAGKWIHFSISKGTLVAYEGARAVFTTLASPGLGGVPAAGLDPVPQSATPLGTFRISVKHLADDMPAGSRQNIAEVPYAQYFEMPFAIHVAYWHENFGRPMSGGCINVSPLDGRFLFDWTLPALPPGWDAVVAGGEHGVGTLVHVVP